MTETKVLTPELAIELLERAVAEKGEDYVYLKVMNSTGDWGCFYAHHGKPSCGVGFVISYFDEKLFENIRSKESASGVSFDAGSLADKGDNWVGEMIPEGVSVSSIAGRILARFQSQQDRGDTWGTALIETKREANLLGVKTG